MVQVLNGRWLRSGCCCEGGSCAIGLRSFSPRNRAHESLLSLWSCWAERALERTTGRFGIESDMRACAVRPHAVAPAVAPVQARFREKSQDEKGAEYETQCTHLKHTSVVDTVTSPMSCSCAHPQSTKSRYEVKPASVVGSSTRHGGTGWVLRPRRSCAVMMQHGLVW